MSDHERVARLRSDLNAAIGREAVLAQYEGSQTEEQRNTLERLRSRIPQLQAALAEAENFSLTGDGEARP